MTNREWLAWALNYSEYEDKDVADMISDCLMEIKDEDDCSLAIICGNEKELLTEWLGKECDDIG